MGERNHNLTIDLKGKSLGIDHDHLAR